MRDNQRTYDVFISYSGKDAAWVRGELLPRLEQAGLKVIIDFRDFEIGVPRLINMERAVDASRHTVVVLTPNWIASEWTEFESLLVGTRDPVNRRRKLVPLMVQKCDLPPRIAMLTYLDMTDLRNIDEQIAHLIRSLTQPVHRSDDSGQGVGESFSPYSHSKNFAESNLKYERSSVNVTNDAGNGSASGDSVNATPRADKLNPSVRDQIFISYSHKDARWLQRLQVHLKPLERSGTVTRWDDTMIAAGSNWREEIRKAIEGAKVAVLLISADFLASDFIAANELPPLLAAAEAEGAVILSIIVSPSRFERTDSISRYQAINLPSKPLAGMSRVRQEAVLVRAVEAIEAALKQ